MKWTKSSITQTIFQMSSKIAQMVNETKLIIAKVVYYVSLVAIGIGLAGMLILFLYWLLSNPMAFQLFVTLMGIGSVVFVMGLLFGWTEKWLAKKAVYRKKN
jgi:hypothetical protein